MKVLPRYIIFRAVCNYIDAEKKEEIIRELVKYKRVGDAIFMKVLRKHFDIELFLKQSLIWQDAWLYNYIQYDIKRGRMPKNKLIMRYYEEILMPIESKWTSLNDF